MASLEEIRNERLKKLALLRERGINPYPIESHVSATLEEVRDDFNTFVKKKTLTLAGRVMLLRKQGALAFFNIFDGTASFQGLIKKDDSKDFDLFDQTVDAGDFIEVTGKLFVTKRGEKTLEVSGLRMLAKSLLPLPEKWHGLSDVEERFRKRYLDLIANEETRARFLKRSKVISYLRETLDEAGYLEVETPVFQPVYGGASAEPFTTHHNALDMDLYLRISDELYLKRLLIGGFPKIYEISKDFRNEGIDVTHWPEFTMLEFYEAFSDAPKQMAFVEKIMKGVAKCIDKKGVLTYDGQKIDFSKKFAVKKYGDVITEYTQLKNPLEATKGELEAEGSRVEASFDPRESNVKILDAIFKKAVRPHLTEPVFLTDYPADYLPLTKQHEDNPRLVDAFQFYAGGFELVKAFSELNDPLDQRARFEAQEKRKAEGETDTQKLDEDFLEAMEYGMPPAGGVGIGIDRLMMLLTDTKNIKEVIFFPTMRQKN